jgi:hypothetical protein
LKAEGVDVDGYNLAEVVEDIESARMALGYEEINVQAVSWGTQIAYAYALQYPNRVHRMLLIGAGGRSRGFNLWEPHMVDRKLQVYNELWKKDPKATDRAPDIVGTLRRVLATLPREWRTIRIDPDKVRLAMWSMLDETRNLSVAMITMTTSRRGRPRSVNRSMSDCGRSSSPTGARKSPRARRQNSVPGTTVRHHVRQRQSVRRSTPKSDLSSPAVRRVGPCRMAQSSSTIAPAYTFRPRNRTDGAWCRRRHPSALQQKL